MVVVQHYLMRLLVAKIICSVSGRSLNEWWWNDTEGDNRCTGKETCHSVTSP
jgi:hypothetical protein